MNSVTKKPFLPVERVAAAALRRVRKNRPMTKTTEKDRPTGVKMEVNKEAARAKGEKRICRVDVEEEIQVRDSQTVFLRTCGRSYDFEPDWN